MCKDDIDNERREFLVKATVAVGAAGVAATAVPFLSSMMPSQAVQAAGQPIKVDISKLKPGDQLTVEWQGKPIWIVHRTKAAISSLQSIDSKLSDPYSAVEQQPEYAKNLTRSRRPDILVLVGICTHLGCSPTYRPDVGGIEPSWQGGFYCSCHGSKFDMAGRVYKGMPAPINLEVPPHTFLSENELLIGTDTLKTA